MICLTGDIHQFIGSSDQQASQTSEPEAALEYMNIASQYGIRVTLFATGILFANHWAAIKPLTSSNNLEIGGHTWNSLRPVLLHKAFRKLGASSYGPTFYQRRDIRKTLTAMESRLGHLPTSWRTHSYQSSAVTRDILHQQNVSLISDKVTPEQHLPEHIGGDLVSLPINVIPDHEHLIHGSRLTNADLPCTWHPPHACHSTTGEDWLEQVKKQVTSIDSKGGIAVMLVHPICMAVLDNFEIFRRLCDFLSDFTSINCKEAPRFAIQPEGNRYS